MKNQPKISVVTICRNAGAMVEKTILSILSQNYPNLEYIVIDGASTDNTLVYINKYRKELSYLISEPDEGISDAFNKGISLATGDIVIILNADDTLVKGALEKIADLHLKNPESVIFGDILYENAITKKTVVTKPKISDIKKRMSLHHLAMFVPLQVYKNVGFYRKDLRVSMDYEFIARCLSRGVSFVYEPLSFGTMTGGGVSHKQWGKSLKEQAKIRIEYQYASPTQAFLAYHYRKTRDRLLSIFEKLRS